MINLRDFLYPGQRIIATTSVQEDFHVWKTRTCDFIVKEVYPHYIIATQKKTGRKCSISTGDLVISKVIDGFASVTNLLAKRLQ